MPNRRNSRRSSGPVLPVWLAVLVTGVVGVAGLGVMGWYLLRAAERVPPEPEAPAVAQAGPAVRPVVPGAPNFPAPVNPRSTPTPAPTPAGPPALTPLVKFTTGLPKVGRVTLSANGRRLLALTAFTDPSLAAEVWDVGQPPRLLRRFEGLRGYLSPDGRRLLAPRERIRWDLVDLDTGATTQPPPLFGSPLGFTGPDRVLVQDNTKRDRLAFTQVDVRNWAAVGPTFVVPTDSNSTVNDLMTDGRHLVVGEPKQPKFSVWDVASGARVGGAQLAGVRPNGGARQFVLSPDGSRVTALKEQGMRPALFDVKTGAQLLEFDWLIGAIDFVPGRELVLARGTTTSWRAFAPGRKEAVAELPGVHQGGSVSADGRVFAAGAEPHGADVVVFDLTRVP